MKVAFATDDFVHPNQHFGWAKLFQVYRGGPGGFHLWETRVVAEGGAAESDKIAARLAAVADCHLVCMAAIGGMAAARLVRSGIHPLAAREGEEIQVILEHLSRTLENNPPPWLRKILLRETAEGGDARP
ncbi:MAG: nitrogen fixation protein NifX [Thermaerobacter sp.]|jgi:nitrogen fixation protein NifX|nr:nitrogen fixation protein NifX [Thermaerobacter sp.]MDA8146857.1 nitrogen fixation protein NifX [Thermaerobacter sp.]